MERQKEKRERSCTSQLQMKNLRRGPMGKRNTGVLMLVVLGSRTLAEVLHISTSTSWATSAKFYSKAPLLEGGEKPRTCLLGNDQLNG